MKRDQGFDCPDRLGGRIVSAYGISGSKAEVVPAVCGREIAIRSALSDCGASIIIPLGVLCQGTRKKRLFRRRQPGY